MELHVTPELGARLAQSAAQQGRNPDGLAQELLTRYFEEESRVMEAVKRGEDALDRSEYRTHEQMASAFKGSCGPDAGSLVSTCRRRGAGLALTAPVVFCEPCLAIRSCSLRGRAAAIV